MTSSGEEAIVYFKKGKSQVEILFAVPEAPSIALVTVDGNRILKRNRIAGKGADIKKAIKEINTAREEKGLEAWHQLLKEGKLEPLLDRICAGLAVEIRPMLPKVQ